MSAVSQFVASFSQKESPGALLRQAWDRLHRIPGGKVAFSKMIDRSARYTGTIGAVVEELGQGRAKIVMKDRPAVRNHLKCVHAIALANLVEVTGNVALAYSLPADARFIVAGMSIDYVKKARGTITGTCQSPVIKSNHEQEYKVPVELWNDKKEIVVRATLRTLVGPKR